MNGQQYIKKKKVCNCVTVRLVTGRTCG